MAHCKQHNLLRDFRAGCVSPGFVLDSRNNKICCKMLGGFGNNPHTQVFKHLPTPQSKCVTEFNIGGREGV